MGMRRALAILKYVPAVLCGLLVVAWIHSYLGEISIRLGQSELTFYPGSLLVRYNEDLPAVLVSTKCRLYKECPWRLGYLGQLSYGHYPDYFFLLKVRRSVFWKCVCRWQC